MNFYMVNKQAKISKDIDLINIIYVIWRNRILIIFLSLLSFIGSFVYVDNLKVNYGYKIYYFVNLYTFEDLTETCFYRNNSSCKNNIALNRFHSNYLKSEFFNDYEVNDKFIIYKNTDIEKLKKGYKDLQKANSEITKEYLTLAKSSIEIIETEINSKKLIISEPLENEIIWIYKNINLIENNQTVFTFNQPIIFEYPKISNFVLLILLLIGPFSSLILIFFKEYLLSLKK